MNEVAQKALEEISSSLFAVNQKALTTYVPVMGMRDTIVVMSMAYVEQLRRGHAVKMTVDKSNSSFSDFLRELAAAYEEKTKPA